MNAKNTEANAQESQPVSKEFQEFERDHGGDAVNAHDDRMKSILAENAEKLDGKLSERTAETDASTRKGDPS
ncbi:hypothetical protein [Luteimonas vadosa]|uniref:Uncharacterized protein n=1 Tax=Luteimonas vadosa TaxID=1165507 RepID=A0ABP9DWJ1_9GAMM